MGLISKAKDVFSKATESIRKRLNSVSSVFSQEKPEKTKKTVEETEEEEKPVLDEEDFSSSEDLEDLYYRYRENGRDVESFSDVYEEAQKDWWDLKNDYNPDLERADSLPHDSYKLKLGPQGYFRMDLNVSGIAHGQEYFSQMDDEVREYLIDEVEKLSEDSKVYLEDGFGSTVFNGYFEDYENVEELDDRKLLGITDDPDPGTVGKYFQKYFVGPLMDTVSNISCRRASEETGRNTVNRSSMDALEDPGEIPRLQHYIKASTLPRRFREDRFETKMENFLERETELKREKKRKKDYEPEDFVDSLRNSYELAALEKDLKKLELEKKYQGFQEIVGWERSRYMVHEAVSRGYNDLEGDIWILAGAAHQADIEQYLEEDINDLENAVTFQNFTQKYAVSD